MKKILFALTIGLVSIQSCSHSYCHCNGINGARTRNFTVPKTDYWEALKACESQSTATEQCTLGK